MRSNAYKHMMQYAWMGAMEGKRHTDSGFILFFYISNGYFCEEIE